MIRKSCREDAKVLLCIRVEDGRVERLSEDEAKYVKIGPCFCELRGGTKGMGGDRGRGGG